MASKDRVNLGSGNTQYLSAQFVVGFGHLMRFNVNKLVNVINKVQNQHKFFKPRTN